jgi:hypothetical protein
MLRRRQAKSRAKLNLSDISVKRLLCCDPESSPRGHLRESFQYNHCSRPVHNNGSIIANKRK